MTNIKEFFETNSTSGVISDCGDVVVDFMSKFPNAKITLKDLGWDRDCDRRQYHAYSIVVVKRDVTAEMLAWADANDALSNDGYGLDDDASDDDVAIQMSICTYDDGDIWVK